MPELRDQPDCFLSIDSMFTNILRIRSQRERFEFLVNPASTYDASNDGIALAA
jgi:hypothetical protein